MTVWDSDPDNLVRQRELVDRFKVDYMKQACPGEKLQLIGLEPTKTRFGLT